jgi:FkbM family methyltransferase
MFYIENKLRRNVLLSCDHGLMIVNRFDYNDKFVGHGQCLLDHGNMSTVEAQACYNVVKHINDAVIVDVGSNIGTFTTWMARAFPMGKIYAFEPQREIFQMLCGNVAINNFYNVYAYNMALGSMSSKVEYREPDYFEPTDFGTFSLLKQQETGNTTVIDLTTLDSFVEDYKISKIDLLKIDVEGMDLDVLKGSKQVIEKFSPVIFIECTDQNIKTMVDFVENLNYNCELVSNNLLCTKKESI